MEIANLKQLLKIKLLRINKTISDNLEDIKSQSLTINTPIQKKYPLKLEFKKGENNNDKSILSYRSLKYIPKRLSPINFENFSSSNISTSSSPKLTNNYQINLNEKFNYMIKRLKSDSHNINNLSKVTSFKGIKFKNEFKLKYDFIVDNYEKLKMKSENISEINKYKYKDYWEKIISCVKNQSELFFNSIMHLEKEEIRALVSNMEEYNHFIYKLVNILISELNSNRENNENFLRIKKDLEYEYSINNTEIKRLKSIINNNEILKLYSNKKKTEEKIGQAKLKFLQEKNNYMILINELVTEIKNLYRLLSKNKEYYDKFIKDEIKIKGIKEENFVMKNNYINEIQKLNEENLIARVYIEKLNQKIEELNHEIKEVKKVEKDITNYKIKIKNLEAQNIKIYENYLMTKEELDSYLYVGKTNLIY